MTAWLGWVIGIIGVPLLLAIIAAIIWDNVLRRIFKAFWRWLVSIPGWLKQRFGPVPVDDNEIDIRLREKNPVVIRFSTELPDLSVWFNLSSKSQLDLVLDRMLIEVWITQPTVVNGWILTRPTIPRMGELIEQVYYVTLLDETQQDQVRHRGKWNDQQNDFRVDEVTVNVKAWLWSKRSGWFTTSRRTMVVNDVRIIGMPKPEEEKRQQEQEGRLTRVKNTLIGLNQDVLNWVALAQTRGNVADLTSRINGEIALLKVELPNLWIQLDKIADAVSDPQAPFDAKFATEKLLTPLILAAQQYLR